MWSAPGRLYNRVFLLCITERAGAGREGKTLGYVQFLGAAGVVTGSKHLVSVGEDGADGSKLLVDCGLFQGQKEWRERNWQEMPVPARQIRAVILTHAHLDHSGWIPRLVKQGFRGPIYATPATRDLCGILLPDAGHLQEEDAAFHNKHRTSKHTPALPLYTYDEAQECLQYFNPVPYEQPVAVSPQISFRMVRAGHILGSSMVEITVQNHGAPRRLLFTGDVGRVRDQDATPGKVVHSGPPGGESADILVMESTYGNRLHPSTDPRPELAALIRSTAARGGSVVVPAFAVERTQKFLFMIKELMETGQIPRLPVHADSPLAIGAVEIFLKHAEEFSDATRDLIRRYGSPLEWKDFYFDATPQQSKRANDSRYPLIIISSSGMATGGRIQHHLLQRLPDPKTLVLFIGFQAPGTRGEQIKGGAKEVKIFGQIVPVRAQVAALEQFSDHADTPELLQWLRTFSRPPVSTYLVHGEPAAAQALQHSMERALAWRVQAATWMEKVNLE